MDKKKGFIYLLRSDFRRRADFDGKKSVVPYFFKLVFNQALLAVTLYRISHALYQKKHRLLANFFVCLQEYLCSVHIDPDTEIGERFLLLHGFGVIIHGRTFIGNNVTMFQGVEITVGPRKGQRPDDKVMIGDNCFLFSGVKIIGNLTIGKNVEVGVNTLVLKSVADGSVVVNHLPIKTIRIKKGEDNEGS